MSFFLLTSFISVYELADLWSRVQRDGTAVRSFVSQGLETLDPRDSDAFTKNPDEDSREEILKHCAGVAYAGASYSKFLSLNGKI